MMLAVEIPVVTKAVSVCLSLRRWTASQIREFQSVGMEDERGVNSGSVPVSAHDDFLPSKV